MTHYKLENASKQLHIFLQGVIFTSAILIMTTMFFILGPILEDKYFPAFGEVQVTVQSREMTDYSEYHIIGEVLRECKYIRIGAMVFNDGTWYSGHIRTPDIPPDFMIPKGKQDFGRLRIYPKGEKVKVIVENQCHPFWINHTYYEYPP